MSLDTTTTALARALSPTADERHVVNAGAPINMRQGVVVTVDDLFGGSNLTALIGGSTQEVSGVMYVGTPSPGDNVHIFEQGGVRVAIAAGSGGGGGGGSTTLHALTDVSITSPANNDALLFQTSDSKWHNEALGSLALLTPSGTANSSTFLRGDGTWGTPTGVSGIAANTANVVLSETSLDQFGGSAAAFALRGARGSGAGTASQLSDVIGTIGFAAKFDSGANDYYYGTSITSTAEENIDATHGGMSMTFLATRPTETSPSDIVNINGYGISITPNFTQTAHAVGQLGTALLVDVSQTFNWNSGSGFDQPFTQVPNARADVGLTYPRGMVELEGEFIFKVNVSPTTGIPTAFQHAVTYQNDPSTVVDINSAHGFVNAPLIVGNGGDVQFPDDIPGFGAPGETANWGFGFADNQLFAAGDAVSTLSNLNTVSFSSNAFYLLGTQTRKRWGFMYRDINGSGAPSYTTSTNAITNIVTSFPATSPATLAVADNTASIFSANGIGTHTTYAGASGVSVALFTAALGASISVASSTSYGPSGRIIVQTTTGYAVFRFSGVGTGVLNDCVLLKGTGNITSGGDVYKAGTLAVRTTNGLATLTYASTFGTTTFVKCVCMTGTGNVAAGGAVSSSGIIDKQVGLIIGYLAGDADSILPLRGAVTNIAAQIAGNVQMYPSDTVLTSAHKWITAPANYTMNDVNGSISSMLNFNGSILFGASGSAIQAHALANLQAKYTNVATASSIDLGNVQGIFIDPTFTADTKTDVTARGYGVSFLPKFTSVNNGALDATRWYDVESEMTIANRAVVDLRIGHHYGDAVTGGTVTGAPWTRSLSITTSTGSAVITGAFDASFVGSAIGGGGGNIAAGSIVLSVVVGVSATMNHVGLASGTLTLPFTFATTDPSPTTSWTGTAYAGKLGTQYAFKVSPLSFGTVAVNGFANWGFYSEAPSYFGGLIIDASGNITAGPGTATWSGVHTFLATPQVVGIAAAAAVTFERINLVNQWVVSGNVLGQTVFAGYNNVDNAYLSGAIVRSVAGEAFHTTGFRGARLEFLTATIGAATAPTVGMTLSDTGNLTVVGGVGFNGKAAQATTGWGAVSGTLSRAAFTTTVVTALTLAEIVGALITDLKANGTIG